MSTSIFLQDLLMKAATFLTTQLVHFFILGWTFWEFPFSAMLQGQHQFDTSWYLFTSAWDWHSMSFNVAGSLHQTWQQWQHGLDVIGHFISKTAICRRDGQNGPMCELLFVSRQNCLFRPNFWRECWVDVGIHWFVLNSKNQRIYNLNTWPPASNRPGSSWLPRVMTMQSGSSMKKAKSSRKISQAFGPEGRMFNVAWRLQNSSFRCI